MPSPRAAPFTVAIIDDDEAVRDSLRLLLESADYRVIEYPTGVLFLADPNAAELDCWICDLHMPEMNGAEVLQWARIRDWKVPAIVMTGRGDATLERRLADADVLRIFEKPIADTDLLEWIAKACALSETRQA